MSLEVKQVTYKNFGNCVSINNDLIQVIVSIDFGPRILSFGFKDSEDSSNLKSNLLFNDLDRMYSFHNDKMEGYYSNNAISYIYGGHRLWTCPVSNPETYYPDNEPVVYSITKDGTKFTPPSQKFNDIQLSLEIMMSQNNNIMVIHRVENLSNETKVLGLSGITTMSGGGTLIIPQNPIPENNQYRPNRSFAFWPYSKIYDKRLFWGDKYITIKHDYNNHEKFKIGTNNYSNWAAYINDGYLFIKNYIHNKKAKYPDFNSSFEVYTDENIMELTSLSPLYNLEKGETIKHIESWTIDKASENFRPNDELSIEKIIKNL